MPRMIVSSTVLLATSSMNAAACTSPLTALVRRRYPHGVMCDPDVALADQVRPGVAEARVREEEVVQAVEESLQREPPAPAETRPGSTRTLRGSIGSLIVIQLRTLSPSRLNRTLPSSTR